MPIYVTNLHDSGPSSLREALLQANASLKTTEIIFTVTGRLLLQTPLPKITSDISIYTRYLLIDASQIDTGVFYITSSLRCENITIIGGSGYIQSGVPFDYILGGGIYVGPTATCILKSCVLKNNYCRSKDKKLISYGAALFNYGLVILNESSILNNFCINNFIEATGAGIANTGTMKILKSTIAFNCNILGNEKDGVSLGNGIANAGHLIIANSTVAQNYNIGYGDAELRGGAIYNDGLVDMTNCTITTNYECGSGGGLYNKGTVNLSNTIIANNLAGNDNDVFGNFNSLGYNLVSNINGSTGFNSKDILGKKADLGPLENNGGNTLTFKPCRDSVVVGKGSIDLLRLFEKENDVVLDTDQRDCQRVVDDRLDIGSVQLKY